MSDMNHSAGSDNSEVTRYLEFSLGHEEYAIPLLNVREVISTPETTPIPKSPDYFLGIMNLRGQVISIIDLRKKLKIKPKGNEKEEAVIIVDVGTFQIGVVVDTINKVLAVKSSDIDSVPELETQLNSEFINGVYRKDDKQLTVLLNISKVLDVSDRQFIGTPKAA